MIKRIIVIISIIIVAVSTNSVYSQDNSNKGTTPKTVNLNPSQPLSNEKMALTIGVLQGGGSLIGADLEFLVSKTVGLQAGAGFLGYGAGVNFHFKPTIRSSFISLAYWHQGIGNSYTQSMVGGTFVFRAKKIFTAQLGLGYRTGYSQAFADKQRDIKDAPLMLLYSIGIYFPLD